MVHLGDITKMSGYTIPPVDVITFGSPCQDLSIAGKRAGMAGERGQTARLPRVSDPLGSGSLKSATCSA